MSPENCVKNVTEFTNLNSQINSNAGTFLSDPKAGDNFNLEERNKSRTEFYKWLVLILICLLSFGHYFFLHTLPALQNSLKNEEGLSSANYGDIVAVTHVPSLVFPFFGGILFDLCDHRSLVVGLLLIVSFGQIILLFGIEEKMIMLSLVGNFIFGAGSAVSVLARAILGRYFLNDSLTFAIGMNEAMANMAKCISTGTIAVVEKSTGVINSLWFSIGVSSISLVSGVIYFVLGKEFQKVLSPFTTNHGSSHRIENCASFFSLPLFFWFLVFVYGPVNGIYSSFNAFMIEFLHHKFAVSSEIAAAVSSVNYLVGIFLCPFTGAIADMIKKPLILASFATFLGALGICILNFSSLNPILGILLIAISSSFLPVLVYTMVSEEVSCSHLGVAFGILEIFSASCKVVFTATIGELFQNKDNYTFCAYSIALLLFGCGIFFSAAAVWKYFRLQNKSSSPHDQTDLELAHISLSS